MPGLTVGSYIGQLTAGTQVSSTYEGRHLQVREDELIHPFIADGFVNKGDPVIVCDAGVQGTYGNIVGVAFDSGAAAADMISIDTEGIWNLKVDAYDDAGGSAIEIGDCLYIRAGSLLGNVGVVGTGDAELSKRNDAATQVFFGYASGSMVSTGTGRIAVKVHASPWPEQEKIRYATCPDGTYEYGFHWVGKLEEGQSTGVAGYFAAEVDGTQDGGIYAGGVWMEPQATFVANGSLLVGWDVGFYCANGAGQDMSLGRMVGLQLMIDIGENPASMHWIRVNAAATSGTVDAVFAAANPNSVGYLADAVDNAGANKLGNVPLFDIVGIGICYVEVFSA